MLPARLREWARELGFADLAITGIDLADSERDLEGWLTAGFHGSMGWMASHGTQRTRPQELVPGTRRVICVRMDYWPEHGHDANRLLEDARRGYIARYALGRDYHRVMRPRLKKLAERLAAATRAGGWRVFVDSAPVMEKPLAAQAGLGWQGKHTNLINRRAGSWFLLGEIYTDLPLPVDPPARDHCGSCRACLDVCPTVAIVARYRLDARRCISYLTIEQRGPIPERWRKPIGNRIFGCDDCQLFCPWNKFARPATEKDFKPRHGLDAPDLVELFLWDEATWSSRTEGSALRRPGYGGWLRNTAVALGNAPSDPDVLAALATRSQDPNPLVREHVGWALAQHAQRSRSLLY
ncbi:MAG: tRNA epoxyqueuosine(34) reductase QueG [Chromatiales bacterium]|nr:tRNA epoxyqueuosine(34) reductase QueG [Chromatiales bacterium]